MNEFTRSIARLSFDACKSQGSYGRRELGVGISQLHHAIINRYDRYVEGSVMEWASCYYELLEPEDLSLIWGRVEDEMLKMVKQGELSHFPGFTGIKDVAIALGIRAIAMRRRQGRYPEVNHSKQDLIDFLLENQQLQQLSLF